jgi:hypothetical protein
LTNVDMPPIHDLIMINIPLNTVVTLDYKEALGKKYLIIRLKN